MPFMRIDHIGVAVADLEEAAAKLERLLGLKVAAREEVEDQQLIAALVPTADARFELLQPTQPDSVIGRFLERRGEGVHHICFEVVNIAAEIELLKSREVQLIQGAPRRGFVGQIEFIHPRSAGGVLVEIAQVNLRTPAPTETRLRHVTIATKDRNAAADLWKKNFQLVERERHEIEGTRSIVLDEAGVQGRAQVEFMEPAAPQSAVGDFIEQRGEGVYSLTLQAPGGGTVILPNELLGLRVVLEHG